MNLNTAKIGIENPPHAGASATVWTYSAVFVVALMVGFVV